MGPYQLTTENPCRFINTGDNTHLFPNFQIVCMSRNYIYNILSGERAKPSRDKVIAICIGLRASFSQINRALELVKYSALYPRHERDARIALAVNQGVRSVTEVNLILEKNGLKPLDV